MAVAAGGASASVSVVHYPDLVSHSAQEPVLTEPGCPLQALCAQWRSGGPWAQKQEALLAFPPALGQTICITVWPSGAPLALSTFSSLLRVLLSEPAPVGGVRGLTLCDLCCQLP